MGAASRDLTADDPRGWRLGGAVAYAGLALARLGIPTRVLVGVDAEAATASELDLVRASGADVTLVQLTSGPVFENVETSSGRIQRCLSTSDPMPVSALPAGWSDRVGDGAVVLATVAGELDAEWAAVPSPASFVALGWQGLLRKLEQGRDVERRRPVAAPLLTRADLVVVSEDDLGPSVRPAAAVALVRPGSTLVITRGSRGGTAFSRPQAGRAALRTYRAAPSGAVVDPTGAGDVFLAALVGTAVGAVGLDIGTGWSDRLRFAAAAASLVIEGPGLASVPDLAAVRRRLDGRG